MTIPRDAENFTAHWRRILADTDIVVKVILRRRKHWPGQITCFPLDDKHFVGYWLGQAFWGRASRRELWNFFSKKSRAAPCTYAHAATSNAASIRVLQKCGFVLQKIELAPADARNLECEEALLVLT